MRRHTVAWVALIVLVASSAASLAVAQVASNDTVVRVHVPFQFVVNTRKLPAGTYDIRAANGEESVWSIQNMDGEDAVTMTMLDKDRQTMAPETEVDFMQTDHGYVLAKVVLADEKTEYVPAEVATYGARSMALIAIRPGR